MKAQQIPQMVKDLFNSNHQALVLEGDEFYRYYQGIEQAVVLLNEGRDKDDKIKLVCQDKVSGFHVGKPRVTPPADKSDKPLVAWPLMTLGTDDLKEGTKLGSDDVTPADDIIFILKDWDTEWFQQPDGPKIVQQIRNLISSNLGAPQADEDGVTRGRRMFIFTTTTGKIPATLPELKPITIPLPDSASMREMIDLQVFEGIEKAFKDTNGKKGYLISEATRVIISEALAGLTLQGAEDALALALVRNGGISDIDAVLGVIEDCKARAAEAIPGLTYIGKDLVIDGDMPGYEQAIQFINERVHMNVKVLSKHNLKRGIKGMTLIGGPGTGKSRFCMMCGSLMKKPMYRWDLGETKSGTVGSSEANARRVVQILQAQKAVAWLDDVDKGALGGGQGAAYSGDGGVTEGLIQMLLTQQAAPDNDITFIFTLNRLQNLKSPEMLRRGRMDRVFYVMRPNAATRKEILKTHVVRRNFAWPAEEGAMAELLDDLCGKLTEEWAPAEVEALVEDTAYRSLMGGSDELDWKIMVKLAKSTVCMGKQEAYKADLQLMEQMADQFDKIGNVEAVAVEEKPAVAKAGRSARSIV